MLSSKVKTPFMFSFRIYTFICIIILGLNGFNLQAQHKHRYQLQIQHNEREYEFSVNGIPVASGSDEFSTSLKTISYFLTNGTNTITVSWVKHGETSLPLNVKLKKRPLEKNKGKKEDLIDFDYTGPEELDKRYQKKFTVQIDHSYNWRWYEGEVIREFTDADREFFVNDIRKLHQYFAEKDLDAVMQHLERPLYEQGHHRGENARSKKMREMIYREILSQPNFELKPLDFDNLTVYPYGKLAKVAGSKPVISSVEGPNSSMISLNHLYYAKIDNRWELVLIN